MQFNTLLRRESETEPVRLTEPLERKPYGRSLDECIQVGLEHHPQVLLARSAVEKAGKAVTLARSAYFPTFALVGTLMHEHGGFMETDHLLSATLHGEWTVWEWGSTYYKVQQARAQQQVAEADLTRQVDTVKLEVRAAYLALREWDESIDVAEASIEQAEENYRITVEQYNENITTSTEVLDAQTLQARAQVNYYNALSNFNIATAKLERAMGILREPMSRSTEEEASP